MRLLRAICSTALKNVGVVSGSYMFFRRKGKDEINTLVIQQGLQFVQVFTGLCKPCMNRWSGEKIVNNVNLRWP